MVLIAHGPFLVLLLCPVWTCTSSWYAGAGGCPLHACMHSRLPALGMHNGDMGKCVCCRYLSKIEISKSRPWIVQEYMDGEELSTYAIAYKGRVLAYADNEASLSCLSYAHIESKEIWAWVEKFCKETGCSGQLCFDYMRSSSDGQLYSIECNPRTSTVITEFHDHPGLAQAFTDPESVQRVIRPFRKSPPVYWFWNEIVTLLTTGDYGDWWKTVSQGVDATFDPSDPLPFLGLHYMQVPVLLVRNIWTGRPWKKIDLCIGKVVELGGD